MNIHQINQVKTHLEAFSALNLGKMIASQHINDAKLASLTIGDFSAPEYISVVKKVFNQFQEEIDGVYAKVLPYQFQFQNEYGSGDLHQDLSQFLAQVNSNNFPASIANLNRLIHYQAVNGFWEKSKRKYFRTSEVNVQEDKDRVDLASNHIEEVSKRLSGLVSQIDDEKDELRRFIKSKGTELSEIESLLEAARLHANEVSQIHTKSATLEERITALLKQSEDKKSNVNDLGETIKRLLDNVTVLEKETKTEYESRKKVYDKFESIFDEKLNFVESKQEYFEERNQHLNDLIGREVGSSLFETFKQRKKELATSINLWRFAVPITAAASIYWIFLLFGDGDLSNVAWQFIIVNSLKALPAVGLLYFVISQYVKERNFQEEYAFKSAVALTINSYAEQLTDVGNKDKMIMESVGQIYKSPIHRKADQKDANALSSAAKNLAETVKSISPLK